MGSLWDWAEAGAELYKEYSDIIETTAKVATAGLGMYTSYQQMQYAEEVKDIQVASAKKAEEDAKAAAARNARIYQAQLLAGTGAGATSSTVTEGVIGIESDLEQAFTDISENTAFNIGQFNLQASSAKTTGVGNLLSSTFELATAGVKKKPLSLTDLIE